jgi:prepilin-type N-terminal cleavage/methylation domain-containing protein
MARRSNASGRATQHGFTLLELMIVVALIAIIAAVAIPSLLNARKSANEGRAIATMRSISTCQHQYKTRFGTFASSIDDLEDTRYIAIEFDAYQPVDYAFGPNNWSLTIFPTTPDDGDRSFYCDTTGVVRFEFGLPATLLSPPID